MAKISLQRSPSRDVNLICARNCTTFRKTFISPKLIGACFNAYPVSRKLWILQSHNFTINWPLFSCHLLNITAESGRRLSWEPALFSVVVHVHDSIFFRRPKLFANGRFPYVRLHKMLLGLTLHRPLDGQPPSLMSLTFWRLFGGSYAAEKKTGSYIGDHRLHSVPVFWLVLRQLCQFRNVANIISINKKLRSKPVFNNAFRRYEQQSQLGSTLGWSFHCLTGGRNSSFPRNMKYIIKYIPKSGIYDWIYHWIYSKIWNIYWNIF